MSNQSLDLVLFTRLLYVHMDIAETIILNTWHLPTLQFLKILSKSDLFASFPSNWPIGSQSHIRMLGAMNKRIFLSTFKCNRIIAMHEQNANLCHICGDPMGMTLNHLSQHLFGQAEILDFYFTTQHATCQYC